MRTIIQPGDAISTIIISEGRRLIISISHHHPIPVSAAGRIDVMMFQCCDSLSHSFMTSQLFAPLFLIEFDVRGSMNRSEILFGF